MTQQSTHSSRTPFRRDTANRVWAGVASGIATRLDVAPGLVRAAFIVASFFGGVGFLLYIAGWILIPAEGESDALLERWIRDSDGINWVGIVLIGIAVVSLPLGLGGLTLFDTHGSFPTQAVFAVGLLVVGVLLYRGTFDDRGPGGQEVGQGQVGDGAGLSPDDRPPDPDNDTGTDRQQANRSDDEVILAAAYGQTEDGQPLQARARTQDMANRPVRPKSILGRAIVAALLIVIGLIAIIDNWWLSVSAAQYFAAALIVIGIGLVIGAWRGRARATIFLGIPLLLLLQVASVFHVPLTGGFGDPRYSPSTVDELRSEYRLAAGELVLDLRGMAFEGEQRVVASVGAGELTVRLPNDVDAIVSADAVAGEVEVQGRFESGPYVSIEREIRVDDPEGMIVLDLDVVFGLISVVVEPAEPGQGLEGN